MKAVPREMVDKIIAKYIEGQSKQEIAKGLEISSSTIGRIIYKHEHGIPQGYGREEDADRKKKYVRAHWCTQPVREIAEVLRCDVSQVYRVAKGIGLEYPKGWIENRRKIQMDNLSKSRTRDVHAKIGKSWAKTYKRETLRVKYGLGQKTRLRISTIPQKVYQAKRNLLHRHNYFAIEGDEYALGYDSETRRVVDMPKYNEEYYINKYGLKFVEGE